MLRPHLVTDLHPSVCFAVPGLGMLAAASTYTRSEGRQNVIALRYSMTCTPPVCFVVTLIIFITNLNASGTMQGLLAPKLKAISSAWRAHVETPISKCRPSA
jgi:hypothetical protein